MNWPVDFHPKSKPPTSRDILMSGDEARGKHAYCWFQFRLNIPSAPWIIPWWFLKVRQPPQVVRIGTKAITRRHLCKGQQSVKLKVDNSLLKPPRNNSRRGRNVQTELKSTVLWISCPLKNPVQSKCIAYEIWDSYAVQVRSTWFFNGHELHGVHKSMVIRHTQYMLCSSHWTTHAHDLQGVSYSIVIACRCVFT